MKIEIEQYRENEITLSEAQPGQVVFWKAHGYCLVTNQTTQGFPDVVALATGELFTSEYNNSVRLVPMATVQLVLAKGYLD